MQHWPCYKTAYQVKVGLKDFLWWNRTKLYKGDMHICSNLVEVSARTATKVMQAVLGPIFFQATETPVIIEPTSKSNKMLDMTPLIPIIAPYRDGVGRSTKQEWVAVVIQITQTMWLETQWIWRVTGCPDS